MEYKMIRDLAALMKEMGLSSLEYSDGGSAVKMERTAALAVAAVPAVAAKADVSVDSAESIVESHSGFVVESPMVGVFYAAPGADKDPYVSVGDSVAAGDVLCIIEAMKIMNEITAERDGVIAEIFAANKQVVEFGSPLFRFEN